MNEIKIFKNQSFGEVRVAGTSEAPLFCLADVCKALDIKNPSDCKTRLKQDGVVTNEVIDSMNRKQQALFISESNLYKCVFQSRRPDAEKFQDWVCEEVLPSIRKHGAYMTDQTIERALTDPDFLIELATNLKVEKQKRIEAENKNAILMHVNNLYTMTEIAKELNMTSANALNNILAEKKVQYKINGTWVMYSKYSDKGYENIKQEVRDNGKVVYHRKITQLGRDFILNLFNN